MRKKIELVIDIEDKGIYNNLTLCNVVTNKTYNYFVICVSLKGSMSIMEEDLKRYNEKLNRYYDSNGKLTQYPSKRPMRIIALARIAEFVHYDRKYSEKEVNEIIKEAIAFSDVELIRRELFQYRFIGRLRDGSVYWGELAWRRKSFEELCNGYI